MINIPNGFAWLSVALAACNPVMAADTLNSPFASTNRSPFVQIFGLPAAQTAQLLAGGEVSTGISLELANNFTNAQRGAEAIVIDGETQRSNVQLRYGVTDSLELGLDLAHIRHDGGSFDGFIDNWHKFWGLPDGGRPAYPRDQLNFSHQKNGQVLASVRQGSQGLADISISAGYQLARSDTRQWAVRAALKLPTGDADKLLGSKSTDLALGLNVSDQSLLQDYAVSLHGSAGVLWLGSGEVLEELRQDWVLYGSSTLSWQASAGIRLKLQLDAHSAFYDSALTELGSHSAQLIMGATVRLNERWAMDLAVSEDLAADTAPDVVFMIAIKASHW